MVVYSLPFIVLQAYKFKLHVQVEVLYVFLLKITFNVYSMVTV